MFTAGLYPVISSLCELSLMDTSIFRCYRSCRRNSFFLPGCASIGCSPDPFVDSFCDQLLDFVQKTSRTDIVILPENLNPRISLVSSKWANLQCSFGLGCCHLKNGDGLHHCVPSVHCSSLVCSSGIRILDMLPAIHSLRVSNGRSSRTLQLAAHVMAAQQSFRVKNCPEFQPRGSLPQPSCVFL